MKDVKDMKRLAGEIILSYESRIVAIGMTIENTHQLLDDFRTKRNAISNRLKETVAHKGSMRKKDFDKIMNDILLSQDEKEQEIRSLLKTYIAGHKKTASVIRENLANNEMTSAEDEKNRIEKFRKNFQDIQNQQQCRENEVREKLLDFQREYNKTNESLSALLDKDEDIRAMCLKTMSKDLCTQRTDSEKKQWTRHERLNPRELAEKPNI